MATERPGNTVTRRKAAGAATTTRRDTPRSTGGSATTGRPDQRTSVPTLVGRRSGAAPTVVSRSRSLVRQGRASDLGTELVAGVRITHPERVLYPENGITKLEIAQYYARMAPVILPYIRNRPLSLVRCPQGPANGCFFQKHATGREIPGIAFVLITESGGEKPYVLANTGEALVGLAQMGTLELHGWNATADDVERADTLVFDFDPDPSVVFAEVATAALQCRALLSGFGLESFVKTTGGKGLHVVVPLARRVPWDTAKAFAKTIAEHLARKFPDRFVTKAAKAAREGRIFIDYLRNARGATAVVPYSVRARTGATVAVPLYWKEVNDALRPDAFNVRTVEPRVARGDDPWAGYRTTRQTITVEMQRQLQRAG